MDPGGAVAHKSVPFSETPQKRITYVCLCVYLCAVCIFLKNARIVSTVGCSVCLYVTLVGWLSSGLVSLVDGLVGWLAGYFS